MDFEGYLAQTPYLKVELKRVRSEQRTKQRRDEEAI